MTKNRTLTERKEALATMIGARALLRKRSVKWVNRGPRLVWSKEEAKSDAHLYALAGEHCAVTAINRIVIGDKYEPAESYRLDDEYAFDPTESLAQCMVIAEASKQNPPKTIPTMWPSIPAWNDAKGRKKYQIMRVFNAVIHKLYNSLPEEHQKGFKI